MSSPSPRLSTLTSPLDTIPTPSQPLPPAADMLPDSHHQQSTYHHPQQVAHGIGGDGRGTAATGDLGSHTSFLTLAQLRSAIGSLTEDYNAKHPNAQLSGRIIHVSHFLPFHVNLLAAPPQPRGPGPFHQADTTGNEASDSAVAEDSEEATVQGTADPSHSQAAPSSHNRKWSLNPRRGHTALNSGIRSLSEAHEQVFVGWLGDLPLCAPDDGSEDSHVSRPPPPPHASHPSQTAAAAAAAAAASSSRPEEPECRPYELETDRAKIEELFDELIVPVDRCELPSNEDGQEKTSIPSMDDARGIKYVPVWMDYDVAHGHYEGYCKQTLWPLFHYLLWQDVPQPFSSSFKPKVTKSNARATHPADAADIDKSKSGSSTGHDRLGSSSTASKTSPDAQHPHLHEAGQERDRSAPSERGTDRPDDKEDGLAGDASLICQDPPKSSTWAYYHAANLAFAKKIAEVYKPGDMIWVHDYHLLLVPLMLRKLIPDAAIGLFVHAPFPSSEVFRCLPKRREIIEGMLGADLACFQAFSYSRHFLSSCIRVCGFEASSNTVESPSGHTTSISYNPIGVDADRVRRDASAAGVMPKIAAIREMYRGKKIIIGRDKLDVVRGVTQKLQAFYKLLADFPEWRGNVVLIQVTAPSSNESRSLERRVSELVSQINGEFGSLSFTPVHHYHQVIERDEYFALLAVADLALITSVRDGMNTTSLEYVIAQEARFKAETAAAATSTSAGASNSQATLSDPDYTGPSPLILSEFTGTAGRMRSAIQVNPWNTTGVAKAIDYGLRMGTAEKKARHALLYTQVVSHTSHTWAAQLVKQLLVRLESGQAAHFTPPLERQRLVDAYNSAKRRLLLLDYDGTLTPIVKDPEAALPSKELLVALQTLTEDPRNVMFIISGRDERFLSKHLGHLRGIGFSAEHGCFVKEPGSDQWSNLTKDLDMSWMAEVKKVFQYYTERTAGSNIEQKKSSITWHYRNADPDYGSFQAKECQAHLENLTTQNDLAVEVLVGKKNLEVRPLAVNKGEIVKRILHQHAQTVDLVFCAGDDKTDEDMFRALGSLEPATPMVMAAIAASKGGRGRAARVLKAGGAVAGASGLGLGERADGGDFEDEQDDDIARGVSPIRTGGPNGVPAAIAALASISPPTYERVEHEEEELHKQAGSGGTGGSHSIAQLSASNELCLPLTMSQPAPLGGSGGMMGGSGSSAKRASSSSPAPPAPVSGSESRGGVGASSSTSTISRQSSRTSVVDSVTTSASASGQDDDDEGLTTDSAATSVSGSPAENAAESGTTPNDAALSKKKQGATSSNPKTTARTGGRAANVKSSSSGNIDRPLVLLPELRKKNIFTTMVGPSGKKTLASWHVDGPEIVIGCLVDMAAGQPEASVQKIENATPAAAAAAADGSDK
ncbi:hypothetical protein OC846_000754 [Tilletia horrida]|uniref:Trehalose-phosphatase n=1 Tax=Tilletia horrida TaxID=155126 RepID=A0AAN6GWK4_9BASI|nr:hypothetical protein OC846_000754 [Tilletia horrida]